MNFKVSLFSIFKKITSKYNKVTKDNRKKVQDVRRSTISEGNLNGILNRFRSKKASLMNPTLLMDYQNSLANPLKE